MYVAGFVGSFVSSVFTEFIVKTASTLYFDVYLVCVRALLSLSMPKRLLTKIAILPKVNKYNVINYWLCGSRKYVKVNIRLLFLPRGHGVDACYLTSF